MLYYLHVHSFLLIVHECDEIDTIVFIFKEIAWNEIF